MQQIVNCGDLVGTFAPWMTSNTVATRQYGSICFLYFLYTPLKAFDPPCFDPAGGIGEPQGPPQRVHVRGTLSERIVKRSVSARVEMKVFCK